MTAPRPATPAPGVGKTFAGSGPDRGRTGWALLVLLAPTPGWAQTPGGSARPVTEAELVGNWKELDDLDRRPQSYTFTLSRPDRPDVEPLRATVKVRPDRWLTAGEHQGTRSVFSTSPQYAFLLWRVPGGTGWTLRVFEGDPSGRAAADLARNADPAGSHRPLGTLFTAHAPGDPPAPTGYEISRRPGFKVVRVTQPEAGHDRVEFTWGDCSGWLVTDRGNRSAVVRSEIRRGKATPTGHPEVIEMRRELQGEGAALRCRRVELVYRHGATGAGLRREVLEFGDYSEAPVPDEEFTLSHYGLPEPAGRPPGKGVPNSVWFLVGAAGFGLLAVLLRSAARRHAPPVGRGAP